MIKAADLIKLAISREDYKFANIEKLLNFLKKEDIYPKFQKFENNGTDARVVIDGKEVLMFSSNNYMGLATNRKVVEGARKQLDIHGGGPGGSRFLCGNIKVLEELDEVVAKTVGKEAAITFPTGYMANLAVFSAVMDPFFMNGVPYAKGSGVIFSDEYNHATIIDGCRLSSSKKVVFKHNDIVDLENKLKKYSKNKHKLIVTEGVFSLDGHLGKLKEIAALAEKYNCIFMVDDAHGVGVMGNDGGGVPQYLGITDKVDILMGSFDKTIGCMGGYLAGKKELIDYLKVASRPYIFSSAVPGVLAGGAIESLKICQNAEGKKLRKKLMDNSVYLKDKLTAMGYTVLGDGTISVLPVVIGDEDLSVKFSDRLLELGVYIPCFRWPAVPKNSARARVTIMATHEKKDLDAAAAAFEKAGKEFGLI